MRDFNELDAELAKRFKGLSELANPSLKELANVVFSARIRKGYTQAELAEKAQVPVETINRIEGGSMEVPIALSTKILKAVDVE